MPAPEIRPQTNTGNASGFRERWARLPRYQRYGLPAGIALLAVTGCMSVPSDTTANRTVIPAPASHPNGPHSRLTGPLPRVKVLAPGSLHLEIEQGGANTFRDYTHASGAGPRLGPGALAQVNCVQAGPAEALPSAIDKQTGYAEWYYLVGPGQYAGYYIAADTFVNNALKSLTMQVPLDTRVPACPAPEAASKAAASSPTLRGTQR